MEFTWTAEGIPVDLTAATAEFVLIGDGVRLDDATVTLGGTAGTISLKIGEAATANYAFATGTHYFDVSFGGDVWRLFQGAAVVIPAPVGESDD